MFVLFLIKLSSSKQTYYGKVSPHISQTPCPVCGCDDKEPLLQDYPAGPCLELPPLPKGRGKLCGFSPTDLRQLQNCWLVDPTRGWAELADRSRCWLLNHEVHLAEASGFPAVFAQDHWQPSHRASALVPATRPFQEVAKYGARSLDAERSAWLLPPSTSPTRGKL